MRYNNNDHDPFEPTYYNKYGTHHNNYYGTQHNISNHGYWNNDYQKKLAEEKKRQKKKRRTRN